MDANSLSAFIARRNSQPCCGASGDPYAFVGSSTGGSSSSADDERKKPWLRRRLSALERQMAPHEVPGGAIGGGSGSVYGPRNPRPAGGGLAAIRGAKAAAGAAPKVTRWQKKSGVGLGAGAGSQQQQRERGVRQECEPTALLAGFVGALVADEGGLAASAPPQRCSAIAEAGDFLRWVGEGAPLGDSGGGGAGAGADHNLVLRRYCGLRLHAARGGGGAAVGRAAGRRAAGDEREPDGGGTHPRLAAVMLRAPYLVEHIFGFVGADVGGAADARRVCGAWRRALAFQSRPAAMVRGVDKSGDLAHCPAGLRCLRVDGALADYSCASLLAHGCAGGRAVGAASLHFGALRELVVGDGASPAALLALALALGSGACAGLRRLRVTAHADSGGNVYDALGAALRSGACAFAPLLQLLAVSRAAAGDDAIIALLGGAAALKAVGGRGAAPATSTLARLPALHVLDLRETRLSARGATAVAHALAAAAGGAGGGAPHSLRALWLGGNSSAGAGCAALFKGAMRLCGRLASLDLRNCGAGSLEGRQLAGALDSRGGAAASLRELDISGCAGAADHLGAALTGAGPELRLEALDVRATKLGLGPALALLKGLRVSCAGLLALRLSHNGLPAKAFEELCATMSSQKGLLCLRVLEVGHNDAQAAGMRAVATCLRSSPETGAGNALVSLDLACVGAGWRGCVEVAQELLRGACPKLLELKMGRNASVASGAKEFQAKLRAVTEQRPAIRVHGIDDLIPEVLDLMNSR
jgi:hypothetical protein